MPLFKFKNGKKDKKVPSPPKKAASMNNIYNDYSGVYQGEHKNEDPEPQNYRERRVSASSVPVEPRIKELESQNEQLKNENNLLTLKVELLLDMLAQKTAEADFLFEDMEKMRKILVKAHPPARKS